MKLCSLARCSAFVRRSMLVVQAAEPPELASRQCLFPHALFGRADQASQPQVQENLSHLGPFRRPFHSTLCIDRPRAKVLQKSR
jgi:hypothetical protein